MYRVALIIVVLCVQAQMLNAQRSSAEIVGTITDSTGAAVGEAQVAISNEGTGMKRGVKTSGLGYYAAPMLPPGNYRITVTHPGFNPVTRAGITLDVNQSARIDFVLEVGSVAESVVVLANASQVDTQTATLKAVVDQRRITELPLNGRDPTQLVFLLPGVYSTNETSGLRQAASASGIEQPGVASNGARGNMVSYALDGAPHNDTFTNVSLMMPNPDALQEFSVQTNNFSAEHGRSAGGVVSAVTRSGTNALHGNLFEFIRNNAFNARNFFAATDDGLKRHQFGGSLGGPVFIPKLYDGRDRTFFFFSHQETRQVQRPATSSTVVLTEAQRAGNFSAYRGNLIDPAGGQPFAGKIIPVARMNPVTKNILNQLIPLPSEPDTGVLWYSRPNNARLRQSVLRVDHQISSMNSLNVRYLYNFYEQPSFDSPLLFEALRQTVAPSHNLSIGDTHVFSPTLLNQINFSFNRRHGDRNAVWDTSYTDLGMRNVFSDKPNPVGFGLFVTGAFSADTSELVRTAVRNHTLSDTLRWSTGRHQISLGFEYNFQSLDKNWRWQVDPYIWFTGYATGYGVADFFLGDVGRLIQSAYGQVGEMSAPGYSAFFQDNVRVTRNLTLNLGIRLEPFIPYVDKGNRVTVFRPGQQSQIFKNAPLGLIYPGDSGVPRAGTASSLANFAPRFGFAWAPFGNSRTSIRGGYGVFYDSGLMSAIANIFQGVAPFGTKVDLAPPPGPFDDPYLGASPFPLPFPPPSDIAFPKSINAATYPERFRVGYLQDWNLTIEREVARDTVARISYAGSKGTALLQGRELNSAVYIPGQSTIANVNSRRPYAPALNSITEVGSTGNSSFQSMQLALDRRFSSGFTFMANYTWAKSIDYGSGAGTLWPNYTNPNDFGFDRGLSDFDRRHRFVASGLFELPRFGTQPPLVRFLAGGWSLAGVMTLQSGPSFSVRSGVDNSRSGVNLDRADLVGDIARPAGVDPVREWFNKAAFVANAVGTFGNSGRNLVTGPGMAVVNASLAKSFPAYKESTIQFRAEFFNVANRANFISKRSEAVNSGTYGRLTSAEDPRILQFALKWIF
ncbi:MAG: TonB-dependent receptor [Bryobacterales bacterium]|nr:TonB-dependent receptor [Bryobacterales bacterium]